MTEETMVEETETSDDGKDHETQPQRTEQEKTIYNLKKTAEKARELGIKPEEVLGLKQQIKVDDTLSDDTPLTVGAFRELQKQDSKKTALDLADDIEDEGERIEVKTLLEKRLLPSGDPHADLALVRAAVNAKRTSMLAEEEARKVKAKQIASGGSADGKQEEQFAPSADEMIFMGSPYNLSKEQILEARKRKG